MGLMQDLLGSIGVGFREAMIHGTIGAIGGLTIGWLKMAQIRDDSEEARARRAMLEDAIRLAAGTHRAAAATLMLKQMRKLDRRLLRDGRLQPELGLLEAALQRQTKSGKSKRWDPAKEEAELGFCVDEFVRKWRTVQPAETLRASAEPPTAASCPASAPRAI